MGFWSKIGSFFKGLIFRSGLDSFVKNHISAVTQIVLQRLTDSPGSSFHQLRDVLFADVAEYLKRQNLVSPGTWIVIVLNLAFDALKAKGKV